MDLYIKLFLIFVLIIEIMGFYTIINASLIYKKTNKFSNLKFLSICLIGILVIFTTLFATIFLIWHNFKSLFVFWIGAVSVKFSNCHHGHRNLV